MNDKLIECPNCQDDLTIIPVRNLFENYDHYSCECGFSSEQLTLPECEYKPVDEVMEFFYNGEQVKITIHA